MVSLRPDRFGVEGSSRIACGSRETSTDGGPGWVVRVEGRAPRRPAVDVGLGRHARPKTAPEVRDRNVRHDVVRHHVALPVPCLPHGLGGEGDPATVVDTAPVRDGVSPDAPLCVGVVRVPLTHDLDASP